MKQEDLSKKRHDYLFEKEHWVNLPLVKYPTKAKNKNELFLKSLCLPPPKPSAQTIIRGKASGSERLEFNFLDLCPLFIGSNLKLEVDQERFLFVSKPAYEVLKQISSLSSQHFQTNSPLNEKKLFQNATVIDPAEHSKNKINSEI